MISMNLRSSIDEVTSLSFRAMQYTSDGFFVLLHPAKLSWSVKVVGHVTISYSSSLLVRAIKFRLPAQVISPGSIAAMLVPFSRL